MTKKDYVIIARALNAIGWNYQGDKKGNKVLADVVAILSQELKHQNPRFNIDKFVEAVYKK